MYVEKIFVYLVIGIMLLLLFRLWRNEVKLYKVEKVISLMYSHDNDVDKTLKVLIDIIDKLFKGLMEGAKKREKGNERGEEGSHEGQGQ